MRQTLSVTELAGDAAHAQNVLGRLLLDDLDDIVCRDDAHQALVRIHDGGRGKVVTLKSSRHLLLVGQNVDGMNVAIGNLLDLHAGLGAQQLVERHRADQMEGRVDDEDFEEALGKIGLLADVIEGLPHRPERRHRDAVRLHDAAGGIFRIIEASLDRRPLERRELREDLAAIFLVEILKKIDRLVGIELLQRFGDLVIRHRLKHLVAHILVELRERRRIEIGAEHVDERGSLIGMEELDKIGEIRGVQRQSDGTRLIRVARRDGGLDVVQKFGTKDALFVAQGDIARGILHAECPEKAKGPNAEAQRATRDRRQRPEERASGATSAAD